MNANDLIGAPFDLLGPGEPAFWVKASAGILGLALCPVDDGAASLNDRVAV